MASAKHCGSRHCEYFIVKIAQQGQVKVCPYRHVLYYMCATKNEKIVLCDYTLSSASLKSPFLLHKLHFQAELNHPERKVQVQRIIKSVYYRLLSASTLLSKEKAKEVTAILACANMIGWCSTVFFKGWIISKRRKKYREGRNKKVFGLLTAG